MDNFREWLSDNLRYFMLGGAILVIVAVLFVGVRACVGSGKGTSDGEQTTAQDNDQGTDPSSPEDDGETNDGKKEEDMHRKTAQQQPFGQLFDFGDIPRVYARRITERQIGRASCRERV